MEVWLRGGVDKGDGRVGKVEWGASGRRADGRRVRTETLFTGVTKVRRAAGLLAGAGD